MNGKQLFCLSLILLSIAMGMHWHKNRPKTRPPKPSQSRVALNIDDLQLQDEDKEPTDQAPEGENGEVDPDNPDQSAENASDTINADASGELASTTEEIAAANATESRVLDPVLDDVVVAAIRNIPRNPFERSPYAKLVEEIRAREGIKDEVVEKKNVKLLTANFSATIGTKKELVAVIDSRLYRKGEVFQNKKITEIKNELISLESGSDMFLIPKVGVKVNIAEDGTYSVEDNFHKN